MRKRGCKASATCLLDIEGRGFVYTAAQSSAIDRAAASSTGVRVSAAPAPVIHRTFNVTAVNNDGLASELAMADLMMS